MRPGNTLIPATSPRAPDALHVVGRIRYLTGVGLPLPRLDLLMSAIRNCPVLGASDPETRDWYPSGDSGLGLDSDVAPAVWIQALLAADSLQVRMLVPQGFEAYARIFVPFDDHITWTEVARRHGRAARARMTGDTIRAARGKHRCQPCWRLTPRACPRAGQSTGCLSCRAGR